MINPNKPHIKLFQSTNPAWQGVKLMGVNEPPKGCSLEEYSLWRDAYLYAGRYNIELAMNLEQIVVNTPQSNFLNQEMYEGFSVRNYKPQFPTQP